MKKSILLLVSLVFGNVFCSEGAEAVEGNRYVITTNAVIVLEQGQTYNDPTGYYVEVAAEPGRHLTMPQIEEIQQSLKDLIRQRDQEAIQVIMDSLQNENT